MKKLPYILCLLLLAGCYGAPQKAVREPQELTAAQEDSLAFRLGHHFSNNYNFIVRADSVVLLGVQPEEKVSEFPFDTFAIYRNERIVVADIRIFAADTIDSVWIEVADTRARLGWLHETDLTKNAVPDDPISQFISIFSSAHLPVFIAFLAIIAAFYAVLILRRKDVPFVHWRDIASFYPALLCLLVALAAVLYTSIRMFAADTWEEFYYNPTLNPFAVPVLLSLFLAAVWAIIIVCIAVVDVVFKLLPPAKAILYLGGVGAVCIVNYIIFNLLVKCYVGYPLFAAYLLVALVRYFRLSYAPFECGQCGAKMKKKGRCPVCGAMNE
ncbi:MAG: zinc ribbon domain-containing protein [Prevotella sp.]|nr:zinc ribbon domain-containing protein [Prevotella sp.]